MDSLTCRIKEFIQPFERHLAIKEMRALVQGPVTPLDGDDSTALTFSIPGLNNAEFLQRSLAYWHSVGDEVQGLTTQLLREATQEIARAPRRGNTHPVSSAQPPISSIRYPWLTRIQGEILPTASPCVDKYRGNTS